jgi:hypothetical protein
MESESPPAPSSSPPRAAGTTPRQRIIVLSLRISQKKTLGRDTGFRHQFMTTVMSMWHSQAVRKARENDARDGVRTVYIFAISVGPKDARDARTLIFTVNDKSFHKYMDGVMRGPDDQEALEAVLGDAAVHKLFYRDVLRHVIDGTLDWTLDHRGQTDASS